MKVTIRMTKKEFDQFVKEQVGPSHASELELVAFDREVKTDDPKDMRDEYATLPVLSIEAEEHYVE